MVEIPDRFLGDWRSEFPSAETLSDPAGRSLLWARAGLRNVVKYVAYSQARRWETLAIPPDVAPAASALWDSFGRYMAGVEGMRDATVPGVLLDAAENFRTVAQAVGAFDSIPIVGMILDFAMLGLDAGIQTYNYRHTAQLEAEPMGYGRERDTDWTEATLRYHGGTDLTPIWLPPNDASAGVSTFNVQIGQGWTGGDTEIERSIFVPQGQESGGIGAIPNTPTVPRAMEFDLRFNAITRPGGVRWSAFLPSLSQAVLCSWQAVLANTRAAFLVDGQAVAAAWLDWQQSLMSRAFAPGYPNALRVRIASMLSPVGVVSPSQSAAIAAAGYRTITPWMPGFGMTRDPDHPKNRPYLGPLLGDVAQWGAEVQLGRRQRQYLATLAVAYCSEDDPAFRDRALATLLAERRKMLLGDPAAALVDLGLVPDRDYRQALALKQGPGDIAARPTAPRRPTGFAGAPPTFLPARVPAIPRAAPFLPPAPRKGGNANGAALLLLSLLTR